MTAPERIWIDAWGGNWSPQAGGTQGIEYIRADLAAVQPAQVRVKPLVWHNFDAWTHWAEAVCGTYHVEERNGWWQAELRVGGLVHFVTKTDDTLQAELEAAKAAAQADYEARILAAIEPQPISKSADLHDPRDEVTDAARDVLAERQRQINAEGWTQGHDDRHAPGELAGAAACYAMQAALDSIGDRRLGDKVKAAIGELWPWSAQWWKPSTNRRDLVKAGALILAEIERLDRAALAAAKAVQHD